jgi:hypothetical protein
MRDALGALVALFRLQATCSRRVALEQRQLADDADRRSPLLQALE